MALCPSADASKVQADIFEELDFRGILRRSIVTQTKVAGAQMHQIVE